MKKILILIMICLSIKCFAKEKSVVTVDVICSPTECYKVIKALGTGAFGKVFAVEDSKGKKFAIKAYENGMQDFIFADPAREFSRGQILDHSNIVKTIDLFTYSLPFDYEMNYLVLEYVEGRTFGEVSKGSMSYQEAASCAIQLCDALQYAKSFGFLHMDLHALNIMISDQSQLVIIDLGSFFTYDELFNPSTVIGDKAKENNHDLSNKAGVEKVDRIRHVLMQNLKQLRNVRQDDEGRNRPAINFAYAYTDCMYFDRITNLCIEIISKSKLDRLKKLKKYAEIKKISWNYTENVEEHTIIPFDNYIDGLIKVLSS